MANVFGFDNIKTRVSAMAKDTDETTTGNLSAVSFQTLDLTAQNLYNTSTIKAKNVIGPTEINAIDLINGVDIVDFTFKDDPEENVKTGFIAEDTDPILSSKDQDKMDIYNCIGILLKAVQELDTRVKELEDKLNRSSEKPWVEQ